MRCVSPANPAPAQALDLAHAALADYLIPNETEAETLTGVPANDLDQARTCALWLHRRGVARVIVTLGKNGALLSSPEETEHVPPFPVSAIDSSGAGDAFIGSLAVFLAEGYAAREVVSRANLYAALSTLSPGTQRSFVSRERFDAEWAHSSGG